MHDINLFPLMPLILERLSDVSGNDKRQTPGPDKKGEYWAFCPLHADGSRWGRRSLAVNPQKGVLYCHAHCIENRRDLERFLRCLGIEPDRSPDTPPQTKRNGRPPESANEHAEAPPEPSEAKPPPSPLRPPDAIHRYVNAKGELVAEKGRWKSEEDKFFLWRPPHRKSWGNLDGMKENQLPLYRMDLLATTSKDTPVYFVEGEGCVDELIRQGFIATTLATGSGPKQFGKTLAPLEGRHVRLWPDNDHPGREHMLRIQAALRDVAASVRFVTVPRQLPHKGDAVDYFSREVGGNAEELRTGVIRGAKWEKIERGGIRVLHPTKGRLVEFRFRGIRSTRREINTEITVLIEGQEPHSQRVNVLSASAVDELATRLTKIYGYVPEGGKRKVDDFDWPVVLSEVVTELRKALGARGNAKRATEIEDVGTDDEFLVGPFLPLDQPTLAFGDGSSGKTLLALGMGISIAAGLGEFCGYPCKQGAVLYVDYEDSESNWLRRVKRICDGFGIPVPRDLIRLDPRGVPLPDMIDDLNDQVLDDGVVLVIVDSAAPACGSRPENTEEANFYFDAISQLGVTTLTIGHISKGQGGKPPDTHKMFGSSYWHNRARRTWYVEREQEIDADVIDVSLLCRKSNDGPKPSDKAFTMTFGERRGPITFARGNIASNAQASAKRADYEQVRELLRSGPKTEQEIYETLDWSQRKTNRVLKRFDRKLWTSHQGQPTGRGRPPMYWALLENREEEFKPVFETNGHKPKEEAEFDLAF